MIKSLFCLSFQYPGPFAPDVCFDTTGEHLIPIAFDLLFDKKAAL